MTDIIEVAANTPWQPGGDHIEPGLHRMARKTIQRDMVDAFPESRSRTSLAAGLDQMRSAFSAARIPVEQWIGGSFASGEPHPEDLDVINIVAWADIVRARADTRTRAAVDDTMIRFNSKAETAQHCGCDARLMLAFPEGDPNHADYLKLLAFWYQRFGHDWLEEPRGIISTRLEVGKGTSDAAE